MATTDKTLLLIDDDRNLLRTLRDLLEFEGFNVHTARKAEEGLSMLPSVNPDLIILDISMPGMGGIGFLRQISPAGEPQYPVLVMTARDAMREFFETVHVSGFLQKPCSQDELVEAINHILRTTDKAEAPTAPSVAPAILLGEDDPAIARRLERMLQEQGFEVTPARSGPSVVERAAQSTPRAIVMNQVLPKLNGSEVAAVVGAMPGTNAVPVVIYGEDLDFFMTRRYRPENIKQCVPSTNTKAIADAVRKVAPLA
jgi:DNA-binding response OmpR family regulator